jgi:multisubunit Na+/H+ antiporter MnhB subunit
LGLPAGALAARLALPVIPQFADTTPIVLHYQLHTAPLITFAAAFVVLVVLTGLVAAAGVLHAAVPARLREAEE